MSLRNLLICCAAVSAFPLSAVTVVLPETPTLQEKTAARELALHLDRIYGTKTKVVSETAPGEDVKYIYLGRTNLAAKEKIDCSKLGPEEHFVKTVDAERLIVAGGSPRGVLYGVFELLDRYYGVLWPDDEFSVIPRAKLRNWPSGLLFRGKPDFRIRCIHTYWSGNARARQLNAVRNRQNLLHDHRYTPFFREYGLERIYGSPRSCHTYYNYTKDWGKDEEECFSLDTRGRRVRSTSPGGPGQICWTNPKTVKLFAAKLREYILEDRKQYGRERPFLYEVSDNDNGYRCNCANCLAAAKKYKGYSGIVIDFTNRLAAMIAPEFPDVTIQMMAYKDVRQVPQGIEAAKNVWIRVGLPRDTVRPFEHPNNQRAAEIFRRYGRIGTVTVWDWWIMYNDTMMGVFHEAIPSSLRLYRDMGVTSLMVELEAPMETPFYQLRLWLGRRFMTETGRDLDRETDRFMAAYYGEKAAPVMKELLRYMLERQAEVKAVLNDLAPRQRPDLDENFFRKGEELVEKALGLAEDPMHRKHIRKERFVLDYANLRRNRTRVFFDVEVFSERMRRDFELLAPLYLAGSRLTKFRHDLHAMLTGLTARIPAPGGLEEYDIVIDLPWPRLNEFRNSRLTDMPDAAGGKAIYLADTPQHGGAVRMGFYNISNPKNSRSLVIPKEKTPQDEKFHLYRVGSITLGPKGYFWAHPTWCIQIPANQFHNPHDPSGKRVNDYELFMSVKALGPNYVKGSTGESGLALDRIILARKKKR